MSSKEVHILVQTGTTEEADDVRHQEEQDVDGNSTLTCTTEEQDYWSCETGHKRFPCLISENKKHDVTKTFMESPADVHTVQWCRSTSSERPHTVGQVPEGINSQSKSRKSDSEGQPVDDRGQLCCSGGGAGTDVHQDRNTGHHGVSVSHSGVRVRSNNCVCVQPIRRARYHLQIRTSFFSRGGWSTGTESQIRTKMKIHTGSH